MIVLTCSVHYTNQSLASVGCVSVSDLKRSAGATDKDRVEMGATPENESAPYPYRTTIKYHHWRVWVGDEGAKANDSWSLIGACERHWSVH